MQILFDPSVAFLGELWESSRRETILLDTLRSPQAHQAEQSSANTDKVADGPTHMQEQNDGIDVHIDPPRYP
jgi:hypothetical protein